jgi:hypothetical protein
LAERCQPYGELAVQLFSSKDGGYSVLQEAVTYLPDYTTQLDFLIALYPCIWNALGLNPCLDPGYPDIFHVFFSVLEIFLSNISTRH